MPLDPQVAESLSVGPTAERFKAVEKFIGMLKSGETIAPDNISVFVDALTGNFDDTNFKVVTYSLEAVQIILSRNTTFLTKTYGQRLLSSTLDKFGHVRPSVKECAYNLAYFLMKSTVVSDFDISLGVCMTALAHKNAGVRETTVQLLSTILLELNKPDGKVLTKVVPRFTDLTKDSSPAVRSQATVALANLAEVYPDNLARLAGQLGGDKDRESRDHNVQKPTSSGVNKSGVRRETSTSNIPGRSGIGNTGGSIPSATDTAISLFPPPSTQDPDGQSNPLSIVPPAQQASYYPYRPLYSYDLLFSPNSLVSAGTDLTQKRFHSILRLGEQKMVDELNTIFSIFSTNLKNEANWTIQLDTVKALISLIIIDSEAGVTLSTQIFAQAFTDFLSQNLTQIVTCVMSRRSILSREMCIFLELYAQRYGTYGTRFVVDLIDPLIRLLNQKGACYETSADATMRAIIIYCNPKMALGKLVKHGQVDKSSHVRAHIIEYILLLFISGCLHSEGYLAGKGFCSEIDFWLRHEADIIQLFCKLVDDALQRTRVTAKCALLVMRILRLSFWSKSSQLLGSKAPKIEASVREACLSYYYISGKIHKNKRVPLASDDFLIEWLRSASRFAYVKCMDTDFDWKVLLIGTIDKFIGWSSVGGLPNGFADALGCQDVAVEQVSGTSTGALPHTSSSQQSSRILRKVPASATTSSERGKTTSATIRSEYNGPVHTATKQFSTIAYDDLDDVDELVTNTQPAVRLNGILSSLALNTQPDNVLLSLMKQWTNSFPELQSELRGSYAQAILVLLDLTRHSSLAVRLEALGIIRLIVVSDGALLEGILDVFLLPILDIYKDPELIVRRAADAVLLLLPTVLPVRNVFKGYSSIVNTADDVVLHGSLRLLAKTSHFYKDNALLLEDINGVFPGLMRAFSNENPDIRKAVVYCLVDLYYLVGEDFTPYLNRLSASQLKLVTIYVVKMSEKRAKQGC
ncbi:Hypothetical protein GLP15_3172 [Giardia lamblia P15]|uniref:TOG domain-containing protein n=1 Tax=Giardia intestinalis (strain P15) TaxID=658858 RepID=E1F7L7_GIAIA|nr:Hypothetical protein GLP15_3172 [Giardia lamblia P15]